MTNITIDKFQFKRGNEANVPSLDSGEPFISEDSHILFVGTPSGNIEFAKKSDVDANTASLAERVTDSKQRGINVLMPPYNAKADGINDDSTAIQQAIDDANASTDRKIVFLPAGTYRLNTYLWMRSGVTLTGAGMGNTILKTYGDGVTAILGNGTATVPYEDVEISHLTIDGTNASTATYSPGTKGIFMSYIKRFRVLNVHVYNTYATGIGTDFLIDSLIHGCIVENAGRGFVAGGVGSNGIGIGTGWASEMESLVISDCYALNCGNNGIMFENQGGTSSKWDGYSQVINCFSMGNLNGFRDSGNMRMKFVGNVAKGNTQDGFYFSGDVNNGSTYISKETMVTNNVFTNNGRYGMYFDNCHVDGSFMVNSNRIAENTSHGIFGDIAVNKTMIDNNMIYKNGGSGICLNDTVNYSDIKNNIIYENQNNGVYMGNGGSKNNIAENKIFNNGKVNDGGSERDGIRLLTFGAINISEFNIHNNKIFDDAATPTQRRGVTIATQGTGIVDKIVVESNDLQGNPGGALSISGTNLKIRNNSGYNPVGVSSITVGASPFTYTAGMTPETVYVDGGTVGSIQKGGLTIFTSTNKSVQLEPNESIILTYSSLPSMKSDKH